MNHSLSGKIFNTVLVFTTLVVLLFAVLISILFYASFEYDAEQTIAHEARGIAGHLNEALHSHEKSASSEGVPDTADSASEEQAVLIGLLSNQFSDSVRYTLVTPDGEVLYDSETRGALPENHADRPEVKKAVENGQALAVRYSDTLRTDTLYAAVKLDNGDIVRLAETRASFVAFFTTLLGPLLVALAVVALMVFALSRILTARIMKPIDALDFAEPLENTIYEEMNPLLERIDEQQMLLKQQTREIARAETMRRDFSSNVSHEMKTPLQVISGYAELMKDGMIDPDDQQKFAGLIYDEAQAMRSLINDVLILSRLDEEAGERDQVVDLYAAAHIVASRLESFAAGAGVTVQVEGESACIAGSETLAHEMLYNLIENGIRYNRIGGTVSVRVGNDSMGPVVRVSDTGIGIPPNMHDKVFERFFRVDKSRSKETGGTGLGLAIVKHAASYHGGTIELESEQGVGTTFILRFPALG